MNDRCTACVCVCVVATEIGIENGVEAKAEVPVEALDIAVVVDAKAPRWFRRATFRRAVHRDNWVILRCCYVKKNARGIGIYRDTLEKARTGDVWDGNTVAEDRRTRKSNRWSNNTNLIESYYFNLNNIISKFVCFLFFLFYSSPQFAHFRLPGVCVVVTAHKGISGASAGHPLSLEFLRKKTQKSCVVRPPVVWSDILRSRVVPYLLEIKTPKLNFLFFIKKYVHLTFESIFKSIKNHNQI